MTLGLSDAAATDNYVHFLRSAAAATATRRPRFLVQFPFYTCYNDCDDYAIFYRERERERKREESPHTIARDHCTVYS